MTVRYVKRAVERTLETRAIASSIARMGRTRLLVLMLHRFTDGRGEPNGTARQLKALLENLHASRIPIVDLDAGIEIVRQGRTFHGGARLAVAFTVDDGYQDFAQVGWPIFKAYDCPTALFVVPGVIDIEDWFWWDKLAWLARCDGFARLSSAPLIGASGQTWRLSGQLKITAEQLKSLPAKEVPQVLASIAANIGVQLPSSPPSEYLVSSWEELRLLSTEGVKIGAHSMTHPIISRCDTPQARRELHDSITRISSEFHNVCPGFCFPNGQPQDFGNRDLMLLKEIGASYAVTTEPRLLQQSDLIQAHQFIPTVPRVAFGPRLGNLLWLSRP